MYQWVTDGRRPSPSAPSSGPRAASPHAHMTIHQLRPDTPDGPVTPERRRSHWRQFRHGYPGILATMTVTALILIAFDVALVRRAARYRAEASRLRAEMTSVERERTDALLATDANRLQVMVELIRRQSRLDEDLHLAVSLDSGVMYLEREGAVLRVMPVEIGPERTVGTAPDTVRMVPPRGTRTIDKVLTGADAWEVPGWVFTDRGMAAPSDRRITGALGPAAVVLSGGSVMYSPPEGGPLQDSSYVIPGSIRARPDDLRAVLENLRAGMTVYFY
jgi:hypothetical protein